MPGSGSDPAASFVVDAHETGTIATATNVATGDDAAAAKSAHAASAARQAQGTIARWRAVDHDVSAVIGHRGTAAVLRRALTTTRRAHGWMPAPAEDASFDACVRALSDALAGQAPEASGAGRLSLEAAFRDLLASLVGGALTTQLLRAAWIADCTRIESVP